MITFLARAQAGNLRWGLIAMLLGAPAGIVILALLFAGGC